MQRANSSFFLILTTGAFPRHWNVLTITGGRFPIPHDLRIFPACARSPMARLLDPHIPQSAWMHTGLLTSFAIGMSSDGVLTGRTCCVNFPGRKMRDMRLNLWYGTEFRANMLPGS